MKRFFLFISILLFTISSSFGARHDYLVFSGAVSSTRTWNAYDTIYITGSVTIGNNVTLTIAPNTMGPNAGNDHGVYVVFTGAYGFTISGSGGLNVSGTSSINIYFTADRNNNKVFGESGETWLNLFFLGSTGSSIINYALLEFGSGNAGAGGGVYITGRNVSITNSTIRNCSSTRGGAISVNSSGSITLLNLKIYSNTATTEGGGLYLRNAVSVSGCEIYSNTSPTGAGIFFYGPNTITIVNTSIYSNTGVGVYVNSTASGAALRNCTVSGNTTTGVYFAAAGNLANCDVTGNSTGVNSASSTAPVLLNTVLWGNTTQYTGANIALAHCGIQGGFSGGTDGGGNVTLNASNTNDAGPNFVSPASDYHINSYITPLVDGGTTSYSGVNAPTTDRDGNTRLSTTDIGAYEFFYYIWSGGNSSDWSTSNNWTGSPATIPTSFTENRVVIPAGCTYYPTVSSLTLSSRSRVEIAPQAALTVTGSTTVDGGCTFLMQSDAYSSANFISGSSVSGSFTTQIYLTGGGAPDYAWHYVGTPVNGVAATVLTTDIGNSYNLLNYDETKVTTDKNIGWNWWDSHYGTTGFSTLSNKQGYCVYVGSAQPAVFSGTVLSGQDFSWGIGDLTVTGSDASQAGWHLVANPYTSGVDVEQFTFGANVDKTVYYTSNNAYPTYNVTIHDGTLGGTNLIPALQGFFVHATTGAGRTLLIPADSRMVSASPRYKGAVEASQFPILKFNISDGSSMTDEAIVYFDKGATSAFDGNFDSYKMFSKNPDLPQISTLENNVNLAINALPLPESKTIVPLSVKIGLANEYTFNVLKLQNLDDYKVILLYGDKSIDLKTTPAYTFSAAKGTIANMSLVFENASMSEETIPAAENTTCWYANGAVKIKTMQAGFEDNSTVKIFDINGKLMLNKGNISIPGGEIFELPVHLSKGIYIIEISGNGLRITKKIVITY
jgi:hypothetical protein